MPLIPYGHDPFRVLDQWKKKMEQIWERDVAKIFPEEIGGPLNFEVRETDNEVVVYCQAAGLKNESDIQIQVHGQVLTVQRNVDASYEVKGQQLYKKEQYVGRFQQSVVLPAPVIPEKRSMKYKDGILEIRWPKAD